MISDKMEKLQIYQTFIKVKLKVLGDLTSISETAHFVGCLRAVVGNTFPKRCTDGETRSAVCRPWRIGSRGEQRFISIMRDIGDYRAAKTEITNSYKSEHPDSVSQYTGSRVLMRMSLRSMWPKAVAVLTACHCEQCLKRAHGHMVFMDI